MNHSSASVTPTATELTPAPIALRIAMPDRSVDDRLHVISGMATVA